MGRKRQTYHASVVCSVGIADVVAGLRSIKQAGYMTVKQKQAETSQ
jgi:hypothetical protein